MKYLELPLKWQSKAVLMEINYLNSCSEEMANEYGIEPYKYTSDSEEVQEALTCNDYHIEKDEVTNEEYLVR